MLNFLKKDKGQNSKISLNDLPPAPNPPNSLKETQISPVSTSVPSPVPSPTSSNSDPIIPKPPSTSVPSASNVVSQPNPSSINQSKENLEPLPEAPLIIPQEKIEEEEIKEPKPLIQGKLIHPKDLDPRDRFDDLIKIEKTPEIESPKEGVEEEPKRIIPVEKPTIKSPFKKISEEEFSLPSSEDLTKKISNPIINQNILPTFEEKINKPIFKSIKQEEYDLPKINVNLTKKQFVLYTSVDNYAFVTKTLKELLIFFKNSRKTLNDSENSESINLLSKLQEELNIVQQNLMQIDQKLFERDIYG